jgi:small GTP-binding protein
MKEKDDDDEILQIKMILLGNTAVGKTSIINRYVEDNFSSNLMSSVNMTFTQKTLKIDKQKVQLNIWDTVGQEKFRSLSKLFFKDTKIVALVYSITNKNSFNDLEFWLKTFKETIGEDVVIGVMGNKSDLFLEQEVSEEEGEKFAEENGGFFDLVSAKENKAGLDKFITKLVTECLKKNQNLSSNNGIKLVNQEQTQEIKAGCCAGDKDKRIIRKYSEIIKEKKGKINSVFLGEISSGKTSIINRIQKSDFNPLEEHTDELMKFNYTYNKGKMKLDIEINDVDINKKKSPEFIDIIKRCNIFFIVYDVKSQKSLDNIHFWIEVIKKIKENINKELIYILANKNDREDGNKNAQLIREGRDIAQENKTMFKSISAKDNEGINGIMKESVESYLALP